MISHEYRITDNNDRTMGVDIDYCENAVREITLTDGDGDVAVFTLAEFGAIVSFVMSVI